MKRIFALILSIVMVLSLAACGEKPAPVEPDVSDPAVSADPTGWVPEKDIEFVIPFGAGGGNDVMVRKIIQIIEANNLCPVSIVPVNKSGGSGVVGYTYLTSKGVGDEYTLASTSASFFTQPLTGNSPFTPDENCFSFVSHMVKDPVVIVSNPSYGFQTLQDIVDYAKANPGKLKWGGVGNASDDAIIMYMLNDIAGCDITYVPYDDAGLLQAAVLGGHLALCVASLAEAEEHMKAGTMTAIAACADERLASIPDVPTTAEAGYDISHQQSRGIVMNAGVSDEVLKFYSDMFQKVVETPEWIEFADTNAMSRVFKSYTEWADYATEIVDDYTTYLAMVPND